MVDLGHGFEADPNFDPGSARDKALKIVRRITGKSRTGRYRKWHARYVCRAWALGHDGQPALVVDPVRRSWRLPSPPDPNDPSGTVISETSLGQVHCASTTHAQLPPEILQRHGIDPATTPTFRPWAMHRYDKWVAQD